MGVKENYYKIINFIKKEDENTINRNPNIDNPEIFLYFALKNIDLKELDTDKKNKLYEMYLEDMVDEKEYNVKETEEIKENKKMKKEKIAKKERIAKKEKLMTKRELLKDGANISLKKFNDLINLLKDNIAETGISNPGDIKYKICEQLAEIALLLYKDEGLIIEDSLAKDERYNSKDSYIYTVLEEIIKSIDTDSINVTSDYMQRSMEFIHRNYMSILPLDTLKETIAQMAIVNSMDDNENSESMQDDNVKKILDFYDKLFLKFTHNEISLKQLNEIGENLKSLNNEELNIVIDCVKELVIKEFDKEEAKLLLSQIETISQADLEHKKQVLRKLDGAFFNTSDLQRVLNTITTSQKKEIKGFKIPNPEEVKKFTIKNGKYLALAILFSAAALTLSSAMRKPTNIKISNITMENTDNTESKNLEDLIGDNSNNTPETSYNLYYPVLYAQKNQEKEIEMRQAYVAVDRNLKEIPKKGNTVFVTEENKNAIDGKLFTKATTNVDSSDLIFPFTLAETKETIKLKNGDKIQEGSSIYIINYADNEKYAEKRYLCSYSKQDKYYVGEISRKAIDKNLEISPEIVRTININGEPTNIYGYGKTAFKTNQTIEVSNPFLGNPIIIPEGTIVTGFLHKNGEKQEVLYFYYDSNTQDYIVDIQDSDIFANDITEIKEDKNLQLMGSFVLNFDYPASNGQVIIEKGTELDYYSSDTQILLANDNGYVYEVSNLEIPYISRGVELILLENPELKAAIDLSRIDEEDLSKEIEQSVIAVNQQPNTEISTPEGELKQEEDRIIAEQTAAEQAAAEQAAAEQAAAEQAAAEQAAAEQAAAEQAAAEQAAAEQAAAEQAAAEQAAAEQAAAEQAAAEQAAAEQAAAEQAAAEQAALEEGRE